MVHLHRKYKIIVGLSQLRLGGAIRRLLPLPLPLTRGPIGCIDAAYVVSAYTIALRTTRSSYGMLLQLAYNCLAVLVTAEVAYYLSTEYIKALIEGTRAYLTIVELLYGHERLPQGNGVFR